MSAFDHQQEIDSGLITREWLETQYPELLELPGRITKEVTQRLANWTCHQLMQAQRRDLHVLDDLEWVVDVILQEISYPFFVHRIPSVFDNITPVQCRQAVELLRATGPVKQQEWLAAPRPSGLYWGMSGHAQLIYDTLKPPPPPPPPTIKQSLWTALSACPPDEDRFHLLIQQFCSEHQLAPTELAALINARIDAATCTSALGMATAQRQAFLVAQLVKLGGNPVLVVDAPEDLQPGGSSSNLPLIYALASGLPETLELFLDMIDKKVAEPLVYERLLNGYPDRGYSGKLLRAVLQKKGFETDLKKVREIMKPFYEDEGDMPCEDY